jgi:DNA-binding PadR family transcriptional regulator
MTDKRDVLKGTLALMVLKTLYILGPQHGYGIARRIEQISGELRRRIWHESASKIPNAPVEFCNEASG